MNINSFLLRFIARSSDSLVRFIIELDAKLDTFLAQHDEKVANLEDQITDFFETTDEEIERANEAAKVLGNLKTVLTK